MTKRYFVDISLRGSSMLIGTPGPADKAIAFAVARWLEAYPRDAGQEALVQCDGDGQVWRGRHVLGEPIVLTPAAI